MRGWEGRARGCLDRDQPGSVVVASVGTSKQRHPAVKTAPQGLYHGRMDGHSPLHQQGPLWPLQRVWAGRGPAVAEQQPQPGVGSVTGGDLHVDGLPEQLHHGVVAGAVVGAVVLVCKRTSWGPTHRNPPAKRPVTQAGPQAWSDRTHPPAGRTLRSGALTFGQPELQTEGSGLCLRNGGRESQHPNINWEGVAAHGVAAADSEPAENETLA